MVENPPACVLRHRLSTHTHTQSCYNKTRKQFFYFYIQFSSVARSCLTLCDPMNRSTPGLPVHHQLLEFIESVMPSSHLILCRPLLLLSPIPPSIIVFSNESTLRMRWPKYWSFSFSIIPSKISSDQFTCCHKTTFTLVF